MSDLANIRVNKVKDPTDMQIVWEIRKEVFVVEQQVDESMEFDHEEESIHFLCYWENLPVGTARWRESGKGIKLERFAVKQDYRNKGIGAVLLRAVLADLPGSGRVYLHAQTAAEAFYAREGFVSVGDLFFEAGIAHYLMEWERTKK